VHCLSLYAYACVHALCVTRPTTIISSPVGKLAVKPDYQRRYRNVAAFHTISWYNIYISVPMIQRSCQWCSNSRTENHCLHWRDELMVVCQQITAEPCGLDPGNKSTRSTLVTFWSCRKASRSLGRRGTLASLSTVSCRCLHTVLRFAGPDFTTWGSYVHSVGHYLQKLQRH